MFCRATVIAFLLIPVALAGSAPIPKEDDAARLARIYGTPVGFDETAQYQLTQDRLRLTVSAFEFPPDPPRDAQGRVFRDAQGRVLGVERVNIDASPAASPRVWHELSGDFTARVRVTFPKCPEGGVRSTRVGRIVGLFAWSDENHHLTIAQTGAAGSAIRLTHTQFRDESSSLANLNPPPRVVHLQLRRENTRFIGGYSHDGKTWDDFLTREIEWNGPIKVGVYARNLSAAPFDATFDEYTITQPKK